jgi:hypothetical protein
VIERHQRMFEKRLFLGDLAFVCHLDLSFALK